MDELTRESLEILPALVELRRELHANPELGMHLPNTQAQVLKALERLDLEITLGGTSSAVTALLRGAQPGPTVLLRGDMDALPLIEDTGVEYSATGNAMHACGHDLHVAGLVGAAQLLHARRSQLAGNVVFMFQPGEEIGLGAKAMIDEGVLTTGAEPVSAAYGIHVVPGERGIFSTRGGTIMAGSLQLNVVVRGSGGHASAPHLAKDPVPATASLAQALQIFANRRFDAFDPIVLTVTQLRAGAEAVNVIGEEAHLGASIRVLSKESQDRVLQELPILIKGSVAAYGCEALITLKTQTPATINDAALAKQAREVLTARFGGERVLETPNPVMGSEDFSYVLERVPGVFLFLRATPVDVDLATAAPNHSPKVVFDDSILADQASALASLALAHL